MTMTLIDAGVNLCNAQFDKDREAVLARAKAANISNLLLIGTELAQSKQALEDANRYGFFSTAGIHPHYAVDAADNFITELTTLLQQPNCKAVGECGLDYNRDFSPRDIQREVFAKQLTLANTLDLPAYIHERDASDDLYHLVKEHNTTGVVHCFTGNKTALTRYLDLGLYIGITGWVCDERRGLELQQLIQYIPNDRLLIETDAPFLIPRNIKPKPKLHRNEPAYLPYICQMIASLKQTDAQTIALHTRQNTVRLFRLTTRQ